MTINPTPTADTETVALATLQAASSALVDPSAAVDTIVNALDYLHTAGAHPAALDDIHGSATALVDSIQQLDTNLHSAVTLAQTLRDQRETARQALDDLKTAIKDADRDVPEIETLCETLEQMAMDWLSYSLFDEWEGLINELINVTPLDEIEAGHLVNILGSEDLPMDHHLWGELSDWIAAAKAAIDRGDV